MDGLDHHRSMSRISDLSAALSEAEATPVRCAKFRRQELWAYKPVWSPTMVASMYLSVALLLIPLGVVVFVQSTRLMHTPFWRYDQLENCNATTLNALSPSDRSAVKACVLRVSIPKKTTGKTFMYYGINNMYQNARRYARSRSFGQLMGQSLSTEKLQGECGTCKKDVCRFDFFNRDAPVAGQNNTFEPIVPCGLTANSRFNDTFTLCHDERCERPVNWTDQNIAWPTDRSQLFKAGSSNSASDNALITSQDFMVWMRLAPYRKWTKLYRRIQEPLEKKDYFVRVESNFPVAEFDGQKFIYFMESTWFGGPNHFLGIAAIAVGGLAVLLAVVYVVWSRFAPEPEIPPETQVPWNEDDGTVDASAGSGVAEQSPLRG